MRSPCTSTAGALSFVAAAEVERQRGATAVTEPLIELAVRQQPCEREILAAADAGMNFEYDASVAIVVERTVRPESRDDEIPESKPAPVAVRTRMRPSACTAMCGSTRSDASGIPLQAMPPAPKPAGRLRLRRVTANAANGDLERRARVIG